MYKIKSSEEYNNEQLTEHFNRNEFACKCKGKCSPISNNIDMRLVEICEIIRQYIDKPITISSGLRCKAHNTASGGVADSSHRFGWAADLHCSIGSAALFVAIKDLYDKGEIPNLRYCQRYIAKDFCHIDIDCDKKRNNRFVTVK